MTSHRWTRPKIEQAGLFGREPSTAPSPIRSSLTAGVGDNEVGDPPPPPRASTEFLANVDPAFLKGLEAASRTGQHAEGEPMSPMELSGRRLHAALAGCPPLARSSSRRDQLWLTIQDVVCTKTAFAVVPHGSSNAVEVTTEHATDELISAMEWLIRNESAARSLSPTALYVALRGQATRGASGSARAAQADLLHGLTEVPPGSPVTWCDLEESGAA